MNDFVGYSGRAEDVKTSQKILSLSLVFFAIAIVVSQVSYWLSLFFFSLGVFWMWLTGRTPEQVGWDKLKQTDNNPYGNRTEEKQ